SLGRLLGMMNREGEALDALQKCLAAAPLSTDCLLQRVEIYRAQGRCEQMEADARRMIARSPLTSLGYGVLADALATEGSPAQTAEAAKVAGDFSRRARAWQRRADAPSTRRRDDAYDEPRLLALSRDAGAITGQAWRDELGRWREGAAQRSYAADERTLWTVE